MDQWLLATFANSTRHSINRQQKWLRNYFIPFLFWLVGDGGGGWRDVLRFAAFPRRRGSGGYSCWLTGRAVAVK